MRPNLTPLALSSASPRAVRSRMRAPASSRRQEWQNDLGKVRRGVEAALGKRTDAGVRALHLAGDHRRSVVSRRSRSTCRVITTSPGQAVSSASRAATARPSCQAAGGRAINRHRVGRLRFCAGRFRPGARIRTIGSGLVRRWCRHGDIHRCCARPGPRVLRISTGAEAHNAVHPAHLVKVERPAEG